MKQIFILLTFVTLSINAFSQAGSTVSYGPVPYHTLQQTIGEDYVVLPMNQVLQEAGYNIKKNDPQSSHLSYKEGLGKTLKLISIDEKIAHFKDSANTEYITDIRKNMIEDVALKTDFEEANKLFLNKTLWLNVTTIHSGDIPSTKWGFISDLKFDKVEVIGFAGYISSHLPVCFLVKTSKGEIGWCPISISGTNSIEKYSFEKYFLTVDPKVSCNCSSETWMSIKASIPKIGMTTQQVRLCIGPPNDINRTVTGKTITEQYVYGFNKFSYYYFTNGKLTNIQL